MKKGFAKISLLLVTFVVMSPLGRGATLAVEATAGIESQGSDTPAADRGEQPVVAGTAAGQGNVRPNMIAGSTFQERLRSGGVGPEMVVIPAGRFRMGCLSNDKDCYRYEKPVREVSIARSFALSVHEVTVEDYDRIILPSAVGRRPKVNVSWNGAKKYARWLSSQTGAEYRLPSEAEWEYAARGGSTTKYSWGNEIGVNQANCKDWGRGGCGSQWDAKLTAPVGSFAPNAFGLYDMHGNVWEWVEDCWNRSHRGARSDGRARKRGDCGRRILRGGSWNSRPRHVRAAMRVYDIRDTRSVYYGFRVVRTLP